MTETVESPYKAVEVKETNGRSQANQLEDYWRKQERREKRRIEQEYGFGRLLFAEHLYRVYTARAAEQKALILALGGEVD